MKTCAVSSHIKSSSEVKISDDHSWKKPWFLNNSNMFWGFLKVLYILYFIKHSLLGVTYLQYRHTHTQPFNGPFPGLPGSAGTRKVKPIWILVKQETVSGNGISWAICKSAPCSRQITTPAPHHSVFYRPDALPAAQPTASKHWRHTYSTDSMLEIQLRH